MRCVFATSCIGLILLSSLSISFAQQDDDDDDNAVQVANQVEQGDEGPSLPIVSQEDPPEQEPKEPKQQQEQVQEGPKIAAQQEEQAQAPEKLAIQEDGPKMAAQQEEPAQAQAQAPAPIATPEKPAVQEVPAEPIQQQTELKQQQQEPAPAAASVKPSPKPAVAAALHKVNKKPHHVLATKVASSAVKRKVLNHRHPDSEEKHAGAIVESETKAHYAFEAAKGAAKEANNVAKHSVKLATHARKKLERAHDALHRARVSGSELTDNQKQHLKAAEAKLKEATKAAEYGEIKNAKYVKAEISNKKLQEMEARMARIKAGAGVRKKTGNDLEDMRVEISQLREELSKKEGDNSEDEEMLKEMEESIERMKRDDHLEDKQTRVDHDEMKAEIERLREQITSMEDRPGAVSFMASRTRTGERYNVKMEALQAGEQQHEEPQPCTNCHEDDDNADVTPVQEKGIDIDTAMPYGDLEPFGREDTAQELTENSIKQSDEMVDQLERAEVAEEKRAVFRSLTRLRGAAITSFDGVARSQTGNIDEFNKVHKWRSSHPLHHLADEESDISKWAFPENAD